MRQRAPAAGQPSKVSPLTSTGQHAAPGAASSGGASHDNSGTSSGSDVPSWNTDSDDSSSSGTSSDEDWSADSSRAGRGRSNAARSRQQAVTTSNPPGAAYGAGQEILQPPVLSGVPLLPQLYRCQQLFVVAKLHIPSQLCLALHAAAGTKLPVQLSVTAHGDGWSPEQYVLSRGPSSSHGPPVPAAPPDTSSSTLGPFAAEAVRRARGAVRVTGFEHGKQLAPYTSSTQPYDVVLYEQVSTTSYHLHIQRQQPGAPRVNSTKAISPAGGGMGLQVFPGSIQEVESDVAVMKNGSYIRFVIPKALPISQLSGATFPLDIPVRVVEQQDTAGQSTTANTNTVQQMTARLYTRGSDRFFIQVSLSHPLSALVGRKVVCMHLTPDRQLTLTLAPTPDAQPPTEQPPHSSDNTSGNTSDTTPAAAAAAAGQTHQAAAAAASRGGGSSSKRRGTGATKVPPAPAQAAAVATTGEKIALLQMAAPGATGRGRKRPGRATLSSKQTEKSSNTTVEGAGNILPHTQMRNSKRRKAPQQQQQQQQQPAGHSTGAGLMPPAGAGLLPPAANAEAHPPSSPADAAGGPSGTLSCAGTADAAAAAAGALASAGAVDGHTPQPLTPAAQLLHQSGSRNPERTTKTPAPTPAAAGGGADSPPAGPVCDTPAPLLLTDTAQPPPLGAPTSGAAADRHLTLSAVGSKRRCSSLATPPMQPAGIEAPAAAAAAAGLTAEEGATQECLETAAAADSAAAMLHKKLRTSRAGWNAQALGADAAAAAATACGTPSQSPGQQLGCSMALPDHQAGGSQGHKGQQAAAGRSALQHQEHQSVIPGSCDEHSRPPLPDAALSPAGLVSPLHPVAVSPTAAAASELQPPWQGLMLHPGPVNQQHAGVHVKQEPGAGVVSSSAMLSCEASAAADHHSQPTAGPTGPAGAAPPPPGQPAAVGLLARTADVSPAVAAGGAACDILLAARPSNTHVAVQGGSAGYQGVNTAAGAAALPGGLRGRVLPAVPRFGQQQAVLGTSLQPAPPANKTSHTSSLRLLGAAVKHEFGAGMAGAAAGGLVGSGMQHKTLHLTAQPQAAAPLKSMLPPHPTTTQLRGVLSNTQAAPPARYNQQAPCGGYESTAPQQQQQEQEQALGAVVGGLDVAGLVCPAPGFTTTTGPGVRGDNRQQQQQQQLGRRSRGPAGDLAGGRQQRDCRAGAAAEGDSIKQEQGPGIPTATAAAAMPPEFMAGGVGSCTPAAGTMRGHNPAPTAPLPVPPTTAAVGGAPGVRQCAAADVVDLTADDEDGGGEEGSDDRDKCQQAVGGVDAQVPAPAKVAPAPGAMTASTARISGGCLPGTSAGAPPPPAAAAAAGAAAVTDTPAGAAPGVPAGGGAAGASADPVNTAGGPQPQQQPLLQQYLSHEMRVTAHCAASSSMIEALNGMRTITLGCMAAAADDDQTSQQQQQQQQQQVLLQQYLAHEVCVAAFCANSSSMIEALNAMRAIALRAMTQGATQ